MQSNGRNVLEKRRQAEEVYRSMDARMADDKRALQIAHFEVSSMLKIDTKLRSEHAKELKGKDERALRVRRQNLANLHNDEMDEWRSEVLANVETQEDRKSRIVERAYALRDARENERRKFVDERYQEQWRDACDGVRALDSKALTVQMSKERIQQIQDKVVRRQQLSIDESLIMADWNKRLERAQQLDDEKKTKQLHADMETASGLHDQMASNVRKKDVEYRRQQQDAEDELEQIREAMLKENEKMQRRQDSAYARGREILKTNDQFKILEQEEARVQRHQDKILLNYALSQEKEADKADISKKQAIRQSAVQYAEYLKEQSTREIEDTRFVEEVRRKEEEKVWQARDDEMQQRQDAKDYLMRMVDDGRQEQIRTKIDQSSRERMESKIFATKYAADAREGVEKERADAMRRRHVSMDNNDKLQSQIAFRKNKDESEKQAIYLADKRMKLIERAHQQRLAEQGGSLRTNFPLKTGQWYS